MSDRPTPETDKFALMWRSHGEWRIRAGNIERQRDAICEMYFGLLQDRIMVARQRDELLDFLTKLDGMACDDEYGSSDFRKTCRYDIPKAIAAAKTSPTP
jgi:hypothetical protein